MPNSFLVPETKVEANGAGAALELGADAGRPLMLTLGITKIAEQQSLDLSIWGSADGATWSAKPILSFPQKFYEGTYTMLLDLSGQPDVKFIQAKWTVGRWGVGPTKPMFVFYVFAEQAAAAKTA